ncbi:hypothetical protein, partial [Nocardia farcinica]|uniref:hypothetical protein n=1 Tax=Nocardia farcinica TaxID=37329 RepID=UPI002453E4E6
MERGNTKHGPVADEELAHELEGTLRGNRSSRAEEWPDPEPPADDGAWGRAAPRPVVRRHHAPITSAPGVPLPHRFFARAAADPG